MVGGKIAGLLVALGLIGVGSVFVLVFVTGQRIAALIFGGVCVIGGLAIIVSLVMSLFRKKSEENAGIK